MLIVKGLLALLAILAVSIVGLRLAYPLPNPSVPEVSERAPQAWDSPLGVVARHAIDRHPGLSGIRPLADGRGAFAARAILIRSAAYTIDAQYYIWQDDTTGLMLLDELRAAADRGVRIRLLVDDNGIPGLDALLAELDAMPNADVRIFNPFTLRNPKLLSYLFDFRRLNRRMHNKSMTIDGVASIVGGRNIGDIYFGYGEGTHYFDVDAIAIGPVVEDVSASFADYWNSGSAYDAKGILAPAAEPQLELAASLARASALGAGYQKAIEENSLAQRIEARDLKFEWGEAQLYVDDPTKGLGLAGDDEIVVEKLFALAAGVEQTMDLVSAYFIPGPRGAEVLESMARNGVRVRILTNSLEATDVMPVHSAYMNYREGLIDSGVELFELRAMREEHVDRSLPEILAGSASGLHAKVFGFDGRRAFIGSYNLDPRSARLNTEMGILVESPTIAASLEEALDAPDFAYSVQRNENGDLTWIERVGDASPRTFSSEPNTTAIQRGIARFTGWLPIEWML